MTKFSRKGFLFSIITILLLYGLFLMSSALNGYAIESESQLINEGEKIRFIEDDAISNFYSEVFDADAPTLGRTATTAQISFGRIGFLSSSVDHSQFVANYKSFFENNYSKSINANISLGSIRNSFVLTPFNYTFEIQTTSLKATPTPFVSNYITAISITVNASKTRTGSCQSPANDPSGVPITVTFKDNAGFSCTVTQNLEPLENNDQPPDNRQFLLGFSGGGDMEVKFGSVDGTSSTLKVIITGANASVSPLNITFNTTPSSDKFTLIGNTSISVETQSIKRYSSIVLWEED